MQLCHINNGMLVLSYWLLSYVPKYLPGTLHANWHRICLALGSKLHGSCLTFSENINHTDLPQCRESRQLVHSPGRHMGKSWFSAKSVYIHCSSHYPGLSALERLTTYSRIILSYFPCPCQMHLVYMDWQSHLRLWMSLLAEEILKHREVSRKFLPGFVPSLSPSCNFTQCGLQYFRSNRSQYQSLLSLLDHARNTHQLPEKNLVPPGLAAADGWDQSWKLFPVGPVPSIQTSKWLSVGLNTAGSPLEALEYLYSWEAHHLPGKSVLWLQSSADLEVGHRHLYLNVKGM